MIVRYTSNKESLKKWLSEKQDEHPNRTTNFKNKETPTDLTQAAMFLHTMLKTQEGVAEQ